MRWLLLLFIPCIAAAADLTGTWSAPSKEEFPGYTRAVIIDATDWLYFHYQSDYGHRCEAFGIARRRSDDLFVFRNKPEDRFIDRNELYGTELNEDCEISFERRRGVENPRQRELFELLWDERGDRWRSAKGCYRTSARALMAASQVLRPVR